MSGNSRSTQGGRHGTRDGAQDVGTTLNMAAFATEFRARRAARAESARQSRAKHAHLCPECDQLFSCYCSFGWKVTYMRCGCVHDCSICRRVHGSDVQHVSE